MYTTDSTYLYYSKLFKITYGKRMEKYNIRLPLTGRERMETYTMIPLVRERNDRRNLQNIPLCVRERKVAVLLLVEEEADTSLASTPTTIPSSL